jgi:hypothetical protein
MCAINALSINKLTALTRKREEGISTDFKWMMKVNNMSDVKTILANKRPIIKTISNRKRRYRLITPFSQR